MRPSGSHDGVENETMVYGIASYPANPDTIPWYRLLPIKDDVIPSPSQLSQPHVVLHKLRISKSENISSIYQQHSCSNLKVLLIIARGIRQEDLDKTGDIKGSHTVIVIIQRQYKDDLFNYLKDMKQKSYEATIRPLLEASG